MSEDRGAPGSGAMSPSRDARDAGAQVLWLALQDIAAAEGENFVEHKELRRIAREALAAYDASRGSSTPEARPRDDAEGAAAASRKTVGGDGAGEAND